MIAKLIVHGVDREHARRRMLRALDEFVIDGVPTLIGFHRALLAHPCFVAGRDLPRRRRVASCWRSAQRELDGAVRRHRGDRGGPACASASRAVEVDGRRFEVRCSQPEPPYAELAAAPSRAPARGRRHAGGRDAVVSPMQGTVLAVEVGEGDEVEAGQVICIVEAMKMENEITAHRDGVVTRPVGRRGPAGPAGQVICVVSPEADG